MKIVRLQSSNILRLTAVDISPDGNLITIGGKNGAGKSSVLNSIAMVLGGAAMVPAEPIRAGETEAKITVDLGDRIVTRRFSRDRLHQHECLGLAGGDCTCNPVYGDTRSTLTVASKDGAKYASPQAMLDKILGRLTFDPLAFSHDDPKRQLETLRKLVGIDTTGIESMRKQAYDKRAAVRRLYDSKLHDVEKIPEFEGAPEEEQSLDDVTARIGAATGASKRLSQIVQKKTDLKFLIASVEEKGHQQLAQMELIVRQIAELQNRYNELDLTKARMLHDLDDTREMLTKTEQEESEVREAATPLDALTREVNEIHILNEKVRSNHRRRELLAEIADFAAEVAEYNGHIVAADEAKRVMLESAQFPVEGLGLNDEGITFNEMPFAQASSSEQLRVSVAIGLALNPTLKVLLIRNGNLLDEDNLKAIGEQAEAADAQIWMEYVTADAEAVQVMIADGTVVEH